MGTLQRQAPRGCWRQPASHALASDVVGPAIMAEDMFKYSCLNPGMGATIRGLAKHLPGTLA